MDDKTARLLLHAWLHDPPDKALDIQGHVARARQYLETIININQEQADQAADILASSLERSPTPPWQNAPGTIVGKEELRIHHLLVGSQDQHKLSPPELPRELQTQQVQQIIRELAQDLPRKYNRSGDEAKFLALWRWLPQQMALQLDPGYGLLPADTRVPDHTIWQHMDTVAALAPAVEHGQRRAVFLSFSVGPVQSFIAEARSLRDLWTGSMILAYLTAKAMEPVLRRYGPTAIIYPVLRGNPLIDGLWLQHQTGFPYPTPENTQKQEFRRRLIACLPNRFVAVVSRGPESEADQALELAKQVRRAAQEAWLQIADTVRDALKKKIPEEFADWDKLWDHAIKHQFDFRTVVLPWHEKFSEEDPQAQGNPDRLLTKWLLGREQLPPAIQQIRQFAQQVYPNGSAREIGRWQMRMELLSRVAEADKLLRRVPPPAGANGQWVPPKCSMTGRSEAMGPAQLAKFRQFWEVLSGQQPGSPPLSLGGVRVRRGERLGSVALVKRFAGPVFFAKKLDIDDRRLLRLPDTATVAARCWLERAKHRSGNNSLDFENPATWADDPGDAPPWSGHWLHWHSREEADRDETEDQPPKKLLKKLRHLTDPEQLGPSPTYYAVLMMDGDRLGQWLQGKLSPKLRHCYHPKLVQFFQNKGLGDHPGLEQNRLVTPAFHMAISEALANFSLHFVPDIVEEHLGVVVYAGGDDVLALLPLETALACAHELCRTYQQPWAKDHRGMWRMLMGPRATMSAALVVAHYKDDLRSVLREARHAEKQAKNQGRNVLHLVIRRRSGEHSRVLCPWEFVPLLQAWHQSFAQFNLYRPGDKQKFLTKRVSASDRWVYQLRRMLSDDPSQPWELPLEVFKSLLQRQLMRTEEQTWKHIGIALAQPLKQPFPPPGQRGTAQEAAELLIKCFDRYCEALEPQKRWPRKTQQQQERQVVQNFLGLWQAASFLARGRDR